MPVILVYFYVGEWQQDDETGFACFVCSRWKVQSERGSLLSLMYYQTNRICSSDELLAMCRILSGRQFSPMDPFSVQGQSVQGRLTSCLP
jgi:hypothetical protein